MQDSDLFTGIARAEILARHASCGDPFRDTTKVAQTIAAMYVALLRTPPLDSNSWYRIYNEYMCASIWKIVYRFLHDILCDGVTDSTIRTRLTSDEWLRTRYLALYDIVDTLIALHHARLSGHAATSRELEFLAQFTLTFLVPTLHFR